MAATTMEDQSIILLGKSLCWRLLEQLWIARMIIPFSAIGAGQDSQSEYQGTAKKKSLDRFYSARDCFDMEETNEKKASRRNVPAEESRAQTKVLSGRKSTSEQELRRVFDTVDEDRNGKICLAELTRFMKKCNASDCSEQQIDSLLRSADEDNDGFVEFREFIKLYNSLYDACENLGKSSRARAAEEEAGLREAFGVFDKNKDGFISPSELQLIVLSLNGRKRDCSQMIKAVDKDGDGKVNFQEFKQMMQSDLIIS